MKDKKVRRFLSVILSLAMMLTLVACGGNNSTTPSSDSTPSEGTAKSGEENSDSSAKQITIGWSNCTATAYTSAADAYLEAQAAKYDNVTLITTNAGGDGAKQVSDIEDLITAGCDAILVFAIDASTVVNVLKEAEEKGILVFVVQRRQSEDVGIFVGPDFSNVGSDLANHFLGVFGDKGFNAAWLMGENGNLTNIELKAGFDAAIAATGRTDIVELAAQNSNSSRAETKTIVENWITAYGDDLDVIISGNDEMAMGAIMALEEAGLQDKVLVSGVNATGELLPYLVNGPVDITFALASGSFPAFEMAIDILTTGENNYKSVYTIPVSPITLDNVDNYYDLVIDSGLYMLGLLQPYENPIFQSITGVYPEIDALIDIIPR